jgi:hypothetical protein
MKMTKRLLDYKVSVAGLERDGHPVVCITKSLRDASEIMDGFRKQYPLHKIVMSQSVEEEIAVFEPQRPPQPTGQLKCKSGHSGFSDGRPIIVQTPRGNYCTVCGEFFTAPEL